MESGVGNRHDEIRKTSNAMKMQYTPMGRVTLGMGTGACIDSGKGEAICYR
jgi:hypothetical protein